MCVEEVLRTTQDLKFEGESYLPAKKHIPPCLPEVLRCRRARGMSGVLLLLAAVVDNNQAVHHRVEAGQHALDGRRFVVRGHDSDQSPLHRARCAGLRRNSEPPGWPPCPMNTKVVHITVDAPSAHRIPSHSLTNRRRALRILSLPEPFPAQHRRWNMTQG